MNHQKIVIDNGDNHYETPQSDEKVVEATPDETKATEMRKIAVIERNITFENQGEYSNDCIMLTNDIEEVKRLP